MHQSTWFESQTGFSRTDPARSASASVRLDGNVLNFTSLDITNHLLSASILSRVQEEIQVREAALVGHREGDTRAAFCSGMYCKGVKRYAKYACRIGGEMDECDRNAEKAAEHRLERARADVLFLQINRLRASRSKMRQDGCR